MMDPGNLIGNSSSSGVEGMGMGADIVPRIDFCPGLARPAVGPGLPGLPKRLGMVAGRGYVLVFETGLEYEKWPPDG